MQYSTLFIQLFLATVMAIPIANTVSISDESQVNLSPRSYFVKREDTALAALNNKDEVLASANTVLVDNKGLDIQQKLDCAGCCNDCGGCPATETCVCPEPPCNWCDRLKCICPCSLCGKKDCIGCNLPCEGCGNTECVCPEPPCPCDACGLLDCICPCKLCGSNNCECPPQKGCGECLQDKCICAKFPCPCGLLKCLSSKKPCESCAEPQPQC